MQLESKWFPRTPIYDQKLIKERIDHRLERAKKADWENHYSQTNPSIPRCVSCMYPLSSATPMEVDSAGVCMGCIQSNDKRSISKTEWDKRFNLLKDTLVSGREISGSSYDCVIAVSGGKDSYFQVHVIKNILGLNPLLVTYYGNNYTDVGERNLHAMKEKFGVDHIVFSPSVETLKKLNRLGFIITGDMNWHNHCGIATIPMKIAVNFNVPFVIWGEHGYADLCGQFSLNDFIEFTYRNRLEHFCRGYEWNYMLGLEGLTENDLYAYKYPSDKEIEAINLRGLYLNNYLRWDPVAQTELVIEKYGFEVSNMPFERTYRTMSNLDDIHENGIHDYLKYIKFAYGRCTDHASKDIREGRLSRAQAVDLITKHDHIKPSDLERWLDYTGMTEDEFDSIANTFREPNIWSFNNGQWVSCVDKK
jgi:N-acetyl sugar amidotransferase